MHESIVIIAFTYFKQFTLKKQIGERFYHKQIFTIFFQQPSTLITSEKFWKELVLEKQVNTSLEHLFGLVDFLSSWSKVCLTLDCSNTNKDGPGRFRTDADNPDNQVCYFNSANDEQVYNEFVSEHIKTPDSENNFHFKILEVKSKTNKNISFDAMNELRQLNKNDTKRSR